MPSFNLRGKMVLTVHSCRNLYSKVLVGKMDPFCVINMSDSKEKFKTKTCKDGHQNPVFEQSYIFNLEGKEELLHCNVWNDATLGNDHIGRLDLSLDAVDMSGSPRWYQIKDKDNFTKATGEVSLSIKFDGVGLPENSLAQKTHQQRVAPASTPAATPAAAPVQPTPAPAPAPVPAPQPVQPAPAPQPVVAPPVVPQQQPIYTQQPPAYPQQQQQQQQPMYQQQPPQQPMYSQQPMQPMYPQVQQSYAPPPQPMMYASQAPVYQAPPQPVYQPQISYQPGATFIPTTTVTYQQQPTAVVYQTTPQIIGYWPNGQPRYAGQ